MRLEMEQFRKPCVCGQKHEIQVHDIIIEAHAVEKLPELLAQSPYREYREPVVIADTNTYDACGLRVCTLIHANCIVLNAYGLHADETAVETVLEKLPKCVQLLIAVGSGTIHDITRYAANELHIPFVSVPTAASVDGFVSTVAAMTWHGFKKTIPAVAPIAVIADTAVIAKAPYRLTASGVSDLLGKYTALADWKIAHIVTGESICDTICQMEYDALHILERVSGSLKNGDLYAYEQLMYGLLLSGLAMQMVGSSRPASGCEHHMAHLWEMAVINYHTDAYHGEKVSVGLLECVRVYHHIQACIRAGTVSVKDSPGVETELLRRYFISIFEEMMGENTPDPLADVDKLQLYDVLPQIAGIIDSIPSVEELETIMKAAGCVTTMEQIGLDADILPLSIAISPYVRSRLTLMRLNKMLAYDEKRV